MAYDPNQNHHISLTDAQTLTATYRQAHPGERIGGFFGRAAIEAILAQADCVGLKIYFGQDIHGELSLVVTGTQSDQVDQYNQSLAQHFDADPPKQSNPNPLNS